MYAKKSLGQNFIQDKNFSKTLSKLIITDKNTSIIEIGPGHGALTKELLKKNYNRIIAIEKDNNLIEELRRLEMINNNFHIIHGDALTINYNPLFDSNTIITGNLPFNISTTLLLNWILIDKWPPQYKKMYLMFQKEVGERIIASHGSKKYGRLSVITQARCKVKEILAANSNIFFPKPKVDGVILEFTPHTEHSDVDIRLLEQIVKKAFAQRRKKIKTNLKEYFPALLENSINENFRAENLTILDYCNITKYISAS